VSAHAHHLKNLYVYFWRWATLKVFGSGWQEATGQSEDDRHGIICFITAAGFLNGPGFQKMRDDLRRDCDEIWVIDCTPEGHQPKVGTRIFPTVQHEVCIVLAARSVNKDDKTLGFVRYLSVPKGRQEEKFDALAKLSILSSDWEEGASGWRDPFLPKLGDVWAGLPSLADLFGWSIPGVKTHRTWVIAPDVLTLETRWSAIQNENNLEKKEILFHSDPGEGKARARHVSKTGIKDLGTFATRAISVAQDKSPLVSPIRIAFRSFDRQWLPPDNRLLTRPRPELWAVLSDRQVFFTAPEDLSPTAGPSMTITGYVPDQHHYHGRGGRVYPLWKDSDAKQPNIKPALLAHLAKVFAQPVKAEDVMAYLAAVMAHPAFTARFKSDLVTPGLRVPLTADAKLFAEAVALGSEVIWLHCYGERFTDEAAGRSKGPPRLPKESAPVIPKAGAISGAPEPLPDAMDYDPATRRLTIGKGYVENVTPEMWAYEVSGMNVLRQWFSYRRRDRSRPIIGDRRPPSPLDKIQPDHWLPEYTSDLLDLLHVLGRLIALEGKQADLLSRICDSRLLSADELAGAGALAAPQNVTASKSKQKRKTKRKSRGLRG
jgi:hypothetical protein